MHTAHEARTVVTKGSARTLTRPDQRVRQPVCGWAGTTLAAPVAMCHWLTKSDVILPTLDFKSLPLTVVGTCSTPLGEDVLGHRAFTLHETQTLFLSEGTLFPGALHSHSRALLLPREQHYALGAVDCRLG